MKKYIKDAYTAGDEILVFPEYALTSNKKEAINEIHQYSPFFSTLL